jgi:tetraacyldisaccharide 4'-kinase
MYSPQRMKFLLFPLSSAYKAGSQIKNFLYDRGLLNPKKAPLPVISVGNITFGGSEKTPLVMKLISFFLEKGIKPALVTRGYRGKWERKGGILSDGKNLYGTWKEGGDEPFMVAQNFPWSGVFIGKHRLASCRKAKDSAFDAAILDDGFQHRRLFRDLDIVLLDPSEKTALREPPSALKRAHVILVKRESGLKKKEMLSERFPQAEIFRYSIKNKGFFRLSDQEEEPLQGLKGKRLLAVCGIARPERFSVLLEDVGLKPRFFLRFPDHHAYPESTLRRIIKKHQELHTEAILTTEKDAVKLHGLEGRDGIPVYFNRIEVETEEGFDRRISDFMSTSCHGKK